MPQEGISPQNFVFRGSVACRSTKLSPSPVTGCSRPPPPIADPQRNFSPHIGVLDWSN
jgi:hypothetical protein